MEFNDQISRLVNDFVAQVSALARRAAMETLEVALSGPQRNGGRSATSPASGVTTRALPRGAARAKGNKRPADEIESVKDRVNEHVKTNPGQRVEQINHALGTTTKDVALPLKKLIAEGAIRSEGERRATAYFPGKGKKQ